MDAYEVCTACSCHIKTTESCCPFCGVPRAPKARATMRPWVRMSRAQWLAFGSTLAVVGCTEHFPAAPAPPQVADATMPEATASDDSSTPETGTWDEAKAVEASTSDQVTGLEAAALGDAGWDASLDDAADAIAIADVHFPCGRSCDPATQYCFENDRGPGPACIDQDAYNGTASVAQQCLTSFTCACLADAGAGVTQNNGIAGCFCSDWEAGVFISCILCYGSPPARLERLLRALS
jgi:hypothetical protein